MNFDKQFDSAIYEGLGVSKPKVATSALKPKTMSVFEYVRVLDSKANVTKPMAGKWHVAFSEPRAARAFYEFLNADEEEEGLTFSPEMLMLGESPLKKDSKSPLWVFKKINKNTVSIESVF